MGNVTAAMNRYQAQPPAKVSPGKSPAGRDPVARATQTQVEASSIKRPTNNYSPLLVAHHDHAGRITEQYRALRAQLLARYADDRFSIMITSAEAREGKTVTCMNLAAVLAGRRECRTIVVDCDLRKSKIASLLHAKNSPGLVQVLRGETEVEKVIRPTVYPNLFFIPAGDAKRGEAGELVGRPEMHDVMSSLRKNYDYVLMDAPPTNVVSDASVLGQTVREALMVVRMNHTRRESIDKAIHVLEAVNVKLIGLVLTHQKYYIPNYLYRYS